nr:hypothetical 1.9K protein - Orgyia pseudotsugata multicapsid nuclear polyhedrosis virus [Orgyia pseudotsugata multiple nucleopolyhedrovirus]BAA02640.1 ORF 2 minigene [Orgyia pseudotsugata single capsid nuclopolyhedrovirus]
MVLPVNVLTNICILNLL